MSRDDAGVSVAELVALYTAEAPNRDLLRRASELPALPEGWRDRFRKQLA
jgi:MOSC domain-containing protein YiiM